MIQHQCYICWHGEWISVQVIQYKFVTSLYWVAKGVCIEGSIDPQSVSFEGGRLSYRRLPSGESLSWPAREVISR